MKQNYHKQTGLGKTLLIGGLMAIIGLAGGCNAEQRLRKYKNDFALSQVLDRNLEFCGCTDPNPLNQSYLDDICKQAITNNDEVLEEDYHKQGSEMWKLEITPKTNFLYNDKQGALFFSKNEHRFVVELDTLTAYELNKNNKWAHSGHMTKFVRSSEDVYKIVKNMRSQEVAQNNNRQNQNNNGDDVMDRATGNMMGNLSTMGWLKFLGDNAR